MKNLNAKLGTVTTLSPNGVIKIRTKEQLKEIITNAIHVANQKSLIFEIQARLASNVKTSVSYAVASNSQLMNLFDYASEDTTVAINNQKVTVGPDKNINFTSDIVSINFGSDAIEKNRPAAIDSVKNNGVYFNPVTNDVYFRYQLDGREVLAPNGNCNVEMSEEEVALIKKQCVLYVFLTWTVSEGRKLKATLINADKYDTAERFEVLDSSLGGGLSYALANMTTNFKNIQKLSARPGMQKTGAFNFGKFGNDTWGALFVTSNIRGNADFNKDLSEYLTDTHGIDVDDFIVDGQQMINAAWVLDILANVHNIETTEDVVAGLMFQERSKGAGNKTAGIVSREQIFKLFVEYVKANYKCVVIGNENNIAMIHDTNGAKIPNYDGNNFESMILAVSTASKNANLSDQFASKLIPLNKAKALDVVSEIAKENFIDMLDSTVNADNCSLTGSMSQILFSLNKEKALGDIYATENLVKDMIKNMTGSISKSKIKLKGGAYNVQFDQTFMLANDSQAYTLGVTKEGYVQCYCADVIAKNRKAIRQTEKTYKTNIESGMNKEEARELRSIELNKFMVGTAVKYPCPGSSEFEMFRFVTKQELKELVRESCVTNKEAIIQYFMDLDGGCIMISPINILKHKLAGMDTDYDGLTVVLETRIVDIFKEAYLNGAITGSSIVPGYTVVLNKASLKDKAEYEVVQEAMSLNKTFDNIDLALEDFKTGNVLNTEFEYAKSDFDMELGF